jgi:hypothetical protein
VLEALYERAEAGIYLWAVDSMAVIGGGQDKIDQYFEKACRTDVRSERFRDILSRARPHLPASDPALGSRLLQCGIEYIDKCRPDTALVYFEFLQAALRIRRCPPARARQKDRWTRRRKPRLPGSFARDQPARPDHRREE